MVERVHVHHLAASLHLFREFVKLILGHSNPSRSCSKTYAVCVEAAGLAQNLSQPVHLLLLPPCLPGLQTAFER